MSNVEMRSVEIEEIPKGLQTLFSELDGSYIKSASVNRLILYSSETPKELLNSTITALSSSMPGRFFVVNISKEQVELKVALSAQCHSLSKGQSVCSEVIHITSSIADSARIPSIVRSHLLTGRRLELVLLPGFHKGTFFNDCIAMADILIINSEYFWNEKELLLESVKKFKRVIDLQWLMLAQWREAVRNIFNLPTYSTAIQYLNSVTIYAPKSSKQVPVFLLSGWLIGSLNMNVSSYSGQGFDCKSGKGATLRLQLQESSTNNIAKIKLCFMPNTVPDVTVELLADRRLIIQASNTDTAWLTELIEERTAEEALARYFLVGESTLSYANSLPVALELCQLEKGVL